jgi:hypothetical protein
VTATGYQERTAIVNPYELEKIAKQHTGEIRETAAQRQAGATRRDQGRSIRHRTGWALIKLGLSVIPTSKSGPGYVQATRPQLSRPHPAP